MLRDIISFILYIVMPLFPRKSNRGTVLLYHSVGYLSRKDDPYKVNIRPEDFERHLQVISRLKDRIEVTFDDGYGNNFQYAFPLLKRYNVKATFFLITDFIDRKTGPQKLGGEGFRQEQPLTWDEIKIMNKEGMTFGSHSKTHCILAGLSGGRLTEELLGSKNRIEEVLKTKIVEFAYPFGHSGSFDNITKKALKESGYDYAYTNIMGHNYVKNDDNFSLKRIRVYSQDSPFMLKMKIKGAYDWIDRVGFGRRRISSC